MDRTNLMEGEQEEDEEPQPGISCTATSTATFCATQDAIEDGLFWLKYHHDKKHKDFEFGGV